MSEKLSRVAVGDVQEKLLLGEEFGGPYVRRVGGGERVTAADFGPNVDAASLIGRFEYAEMPLVALTDEEEIVGLMFQTGNKRFCLKEGEIEVIDAPLQKPRRIEFGETTRWVSFDGSLVEYDRVSMIAVEVVYRMFDEAVGGADSEVEDFFRTCSGPLLRSLIWMNLDEFGE